MPDRLLRVGGKRRNHINDLRQTGQSNTIAPAEQRVDETAHQQGVAETVSDVRKRASLREVPKVGIIEYPVLFVRPGDVVPEIGQQLGHPDHADPANPDEVHAPRLA